MRPCGIFRALPRREKWVADLKGSPRVVEQVEPEVVLAAQVEREAVLVAEHQVAKQAAVAAVVEEQGAGAEAAEAQAVRVEPEVVRLVVRAVLGAEHRVAKRASAAAVLGEQVVVLEEPVELEVPEVVQREALAEQAADRR